MYMHKVKTALLSVYDKTNLAEFAKFLSDNGVKLISSGGTYNALLLAGIKSEKVEDITNFPEMLEGRVKTLHPKIHAGILAKREKKHLEELEKHGISTIDLVVVNLYPFEEVALKSLLLEDLIENIDIGGPSLIRGAAKNFEYVGVVTSPFQYKKVMNELSKNDFRLSSELRKELMVEAFSHTAFYDSIISNFFQQKFGLPFFAREKTIALRQISELRYGENPHQAGALYKFPFTFNSQLVNAKQLNGKELSYNNYLDLDAALQIVKEFSEPCVAIVKHGNPCGVAISNNISSAFSRAYKSDSLSAFGGIIALNRECDVSCAEQIVSFFNEAVVAPSYSEDAFKLLLKKPNLRVLQLEFSVQSEKFEFRQIDGGMLCQEKDNLKKITFDLKTSRKANSNELRDLEFAWRVVKNVKSNAIVIAKDLATIGIGGGLSSRIDAVELAIKKAGFNCTNAVLASDAFFPFKDSITIASDAGIIAVVEPGGSINDNQVIEEAERRKISLYFTNERHFRH
ncbi:MAG: bifunctional phosphoribosylaminoimidazolecarboxamide formyltransferase/IMP cyclohydrolase [Candidatus Diapherotrites archaeon]